MTHRDEQTLVLQEEILRECGKPCSEAENKRENQHRNWIPPPSPNLKRYLASKNKTSEESSMHWFLVFEMKGLSRIKSAVFSRPPGLWFYCLHLDDANTLFMWPGPSLDPLCSSGKDTGRNQKASINKMGMMTFGLSAAPHNFVLKDTLDNVVPVLHKLWHHV